MGGGCINLLEEFTDEELAQIVKDSRSVRDLIIKLGYPPDSGSISTMISKMLEEKKFDFSHFTGRGWNKNNFDYSRFQYGKFINSCNAISAIAALRGRKCEQCGRVEWGGKPIPLEVHHEDGDHLNNELSNLKLLCCNCHALTNNYRGRNIRRKKHSKISDDEFINALKSTPNVRQALLRLGLSTMGENYARAYDLINKNHIVQ